MIIAAIAAFTTLYAEAEPGVSEDALRDRTGVVTMKAEGENAAAPVVGILQNTAAHYSRNYEAGVRMGHLSLHWNRFQPEDGRRDDAYVAAKRAELDALKQAGFRVMLDFGTQYPPAWVYDMPNSRFVNQYGDAYSGGVGETGVNAVFNEAVRQKVGAYLKAVLSEFGGEVEIVRLGLMRYSEIGYPHPSFKGRTNAYWAYDDNAQGKTNGLPSGVAVCPVPGWVPGQSSEGSNDARLFADWYIGALQNYHDWQIDVVGEAYQGKMAMLYPSWGMRGEQLEAAVKGNLDGSTSAEKNGEIQRGFDFKRLVGGIKNSRVIVYGTWIDSNPAWSDDEASNPKNPCPIHYLSTLAKNHPLKLHVMGENTGGGGIAALDLTFKRVKQYGVEGLMWAFESDLYDGVPPTIEDFEKRVW